MSDPQEVATPSDPHSAEALDLDAIQKRADAATGGPWLPDERHVLKPDKPESTWDGTVIASVPDDEFGLYEFGNTEFIAHARTDVPALVAAVRARDAEVAELKAKIAESQEIVAELLDPDPCNWDHNHSCQAHGWFFIPQGEMCPNERGRQYVAASSPVEGGN